ncbi:MFS transporter [Cellulomonas fengjieae]|uniref:MFS transporter n=1 Tax=Cellulomonas fengjieae TaxID=2819978 RepID=A0ABS3SCP8_9CELL|nr:MFS transporter [Cellulomonas fengjieae]MBO3083523.1 MFS transporter [Cellulomonas fengjieae]MBO3101726.1 MFS transporter [Cellulomonas fengjieae]QVI65157.1 MFS transporter [Cellulomonas fengjieae]
MTTPAGHEEGLTAPSGPGRAARSVERASVAVFAVFFLNGFNFASWAARLPAIRDGLDFSPAQMGLLLLVGSVGSLVALPLSGMVVERLGARRTVLAFACLNAGGLVVAASGVAVGEVVVVGLGLVLFGVGTGVWDASMNVEGAVVEQHVGRTVMPRYHAGFSFGTVAAAGIAAVAAGFHVPVVVHISIIVVLSTIGVALAVRAFLPIPHKPEAAHASERGGAGARGAFAAWLEPRTLLIGLVVLAAALTEGSANDWVSLAVVDGFDVPDAVGAVAFAVFVTAMTAMRWFGTTMLDRHGRVTVLRLSAALSLVGLLVFGLAGPLWLAVVGIVAWGAGAALGFPVGMSAAADDPVRAAARVSVVSTIGYSAFLAGPPLLGLLAQHVGYRHALLVIIVPIVLGLLVINAAAPLREDRVT